MEYMIEDATGYCLKRGLPTLELATQAATKYPTAKRIIEYENARTNPRGVVPTGRAWDLAAPASKPEGESKE